MVNKNAQMIKTTCFPLHSILFAIGNPSIDYFSLDIEGLELDVLKTIPWDKVDIKVSILVLILQFIDKELISFYA